jgi:hypothetical protein
MSFLTDIITQYGTFSPDTYYLPEKYGETCLDFCLFAPDSLLKFACPGDRAKPSTKVCSGDIRTAG